MYGKILTFKNSPARPSRKLSSCTFDRCNSVRHRVECDTILSRSKQQNMMESIVFVRTGYSHWDSWNQATSTPSGDIVDEFWCEISRRSNESPAREAGCINRLVRNPYKSSGWSIYGGIDMSLRSRFRFFLAEKMKKFIL